MMSSPTDTSVLVTGLPDTIDVDSVKIHFSASFHVDHVFLLEAGEAFVVFNSTSAAETAVTDMDQSTLCGNTIQVKLVPGSRRSDLDQKVSMLLSRVCPTPMSSLDFAALLKALSSLSADEKRQVVAVLNPPVAGVNNDSSGAASTPVSSTGHAASGSAASAKTASANAASSTTASSGTTTAPPSGSIPGPHYQLPPATQPGQMNAASHPFGYTLPPPGFHYHHPPMPPVNGYDPSGTPYYPAVHHPGSHIPRISPFSGNSKPSGGEVSFKQWKFEVTQASTSFAPDSVYQGIIKSVRGMAADVLRLLGDRPTVDAILQRFDSVFGSVLSSEQLLEQFYRATQKKDESIPEWACRLEDLSSRICESDPATFTTVHNTLRSKFWSGLAVPRIKDALRYRYDSGASFVDLQIAARQIEAEHPSATPAKVNQITTESPKSLEKQVEQLQTQFAEFQKWMKSQSSNASSTYNKPFKKKNQGFQRRKFKNEKEETKDSTFKGKCYNCNQPGHKKSDCLN